MESRSGVGGPWEPAAEDSSRSPAKFRHRCPGCVRLLDASKSYRIQQNQYRILTESYAGSQSSESYRILKNPYRILQNPRRILTDSFRILTEYSRILVQNLTQSIQKPYEILHRVLESSESNRIPQNLHRILSESYRILTEFSEDLPTEAYRIHKES